MSNYIITFYTVAGLFQCCLFFQPMLVIGGAGDRLSVVSQPAQPGRSGAQSAGVCSHQHSVDTSDDREATGTVTAGGYIFVMRSQMRTKITTQKDRKRKEDMYSCDRYDQICNNNV